MEKISYEDFNNQYSEFPLNEFRDSYPNTVKELINMLPGNLPEPENAMTSQCLYTLEDEKYNDGDIQVRTTIAIEGNIYNLVASVAAAPMRFYYNITWQMIKYDVNKNDTAEPCFDVQSHNFNITLYTQDQKYWYNNP